MQRSIQNGFVVVARQILRSSLWERRPEDRIVALAAIALANHAPRAAFDGYRNFKLERGQFLRSWRTLRRECRLGLQELRTSVRHLESIDFMVRKPTKGASIYTIPNYDFYQSFQEYGQGQAMPEGAVLLARAILESSLWKLKPTTRIVAITALLLANHSEGQVVTRGGQEITLKRGQLLADMKELAKAAHLPLRQVQKAGGKLIELGFFGTGGGGQNGLLTIGNYDFWQDPEHYRHSQTTRREEKEEISEPPNTRSTRAQHAPNTCSTRAQHALNTRLTPNKNGKNDKNGEEGEEAPLTPELFETASWGAPPPITPQAMQLAAAYIGRFGEAIMGRKKVLRQTDLFLRRGGSLDEGLRAISQHPMPEPIWKILDPLISTEKIEEERWLARMRAQEKEKAKT